MSSRVTTAALVCALICCALPWAAQAAPSAEEAASAGESSRATKEARAGRRGWPRLTIAPSLGLSPGHLFTLGIKTGPTLLMQARLGSWFALASYTAFEPQWWVFQSARLGTTNLEPGRDWELRQLFGPGVVWSSEDGERQSVFLMIGVEQRWVRNRVVNEAIGLKAESNWSDTSLLPGLMWSSYNPIEEGFGWTFRAFAPLLGWPFDAPRRISLDIGLAWDF